MVATENSYFWMMEFAVWIILNESNQQTMQILNCNLSDIKISLHRLWFLATSKWMTHIEDSGLVIDLRSVESNKDKWYFDKPISHHMEIKSTAFTATLILNIYIYACIVRNCIKRMFPLVFRRCAFQELLRPRSHPQTPPTPNMVIYITRKTGCRCAHEHKPNYR